MEGGCRGWIRTGTGTGAWCLVVKIRIEKEAGDGGMRRICR